MATGDRHQGKMDEAGQGQGQQPAALGAIQIPYIPAAFQPNQLMFTTAPVSPGQLPSPAASHPHLSQPQLSSYQHIHQQQLHQLEQKLKVFWSNQYQEIRRTTDFKNHSLPLARIKKIMKADEDVKMIAAEAPVLFARACEMFIVELTHRSWAHTEENKRRTLQKNDIAGAIMRTNVFDFLVDIVPREELKDEVITSIPGSGPNDALSYYYAAPQFGSLGMDVSNPEMDHGLVFDHLAQPFVAQQMWEQQQPQQTVQQPQQSAEDSSSY